MIKQRELCICRRSQQRSLSPICAYFFQFLHMGWSRHTMFCMCFREIKGLTVRSNFFSQRIIKFVPVWLKFNIVVDNSRILGCSILPNSIARLRHKESCCYPGTFSKHSNGASSNSIWRNKLCMLMQHGNHWEEINLMYCIGAVRLS